MMRAYKFYLLIPRLHISSQDSPYKNHRQQDIYNVDSYS